MTPITFVLPGPIGTLTGGFLYDKRIIEGLRAQGREVDVVELTGDFPFPDADAVAGAAAALAAQPEGRLTVIDGLALGALPRLAAAQADRLELIALVHHPLADETGLDAESRMRLRVQESAALAVVAGVIVTSDHTAAAQGTFGVPSQRIAVVSPGVDPAPLARGSGGAPPALLTVGGLIPRKGHDDLVEALARLGDLDWQLTCIGSTTRDPAYARRVRERIERLGLTGRIQLLGELAPQELTVHYDRSDVFVLASHHEGYGMVLSEALVRGLPVVSTTAGAISGTVPEEAGLLVAAGDRDGLAEALRRVLVEPDLRADLAAGARRARDGLATWEVAATRFGQALARLSGP